MTDLSLETPFAPPAISAAGLAHRLRRWILWLLVPILFDLEVLAVGTKWLRLTLIVSGLSMG